MSSFNRYFVVTTLILLLNLTPPLRADWDDWMWSSDDDDSATTSPEVETTPKRWTEEGLCDHDPLTIVILKFILETKKLMTNGTALPGLPSLEPFHIPKIDFDLVGTKHDYRVLANMTEIYIAGLSNFNVTGISTDVLEMSANVSVFLDKLTVEGKYHLKGRARMVIPLPVYGHGRVIIESKKVQTNAYIQLGFSDDGDLILKEFDFKLDMNAITVRFQGKTGFLITKQWNAILDTMGLQMFRKMEPKIHDKVRARSILGINKALKEMEFDWNMWQEVLKETISCYFG